MRSALLERLYGRAGHRGIMILLYLAFFAMHTVISSMAYLPSLQPDEFTSVAVANMFIGENWSAAADLSAGYCGFLQSFIYIPALLFTDDPFVQYRMMLAANGAVLSFIPVIVYSCALLLAGTGKRWQAILSAICCGGWMTAVVYGKFLINETAAVFMPWLVIYLLLKADTVKKRASKITFSILTAFAAALSFCADQRLCPLILALLLTVVLSRLLFKRKTVDLPVFIAALAGFCAMAEVCTCLVQQSFRGANSPFELEGTVESFFAGLPEMFADGGFIRFITALAAQLYSAVCGSWGLAALGISLTAAMGVRYLSDLRAGRGPKTDSLSVFVTFTAFLSIFTVFAGVFARFGQADFGMSQDTLLFSRFSDSVMPFTVLLVLVFVFTRELTLSEISGGIISAAIIYIGFYAAARQNVLEAPAGSADMILGLIPALIGEKVGSQISSTGLIAGISCSMCLMAVLLVIVSCAKNLKKLVAAGAVTAVTIYSLCFGLFAYLPAARDYSMAHNAEYITLSEKLFNNTDAPGVTMYQCGGDSVMMIQYINQNINVYSAALPSEIRGNTYVVVPIGARLYLQGQERLPVVYMGQTDSYRIYAYGERPVAYAQAQNGAEEEPLEPVAETPKGEN